MNLFCAIINRFNYLIKFLIPRKAKIAKLSFLCYNTVNLTKIYSLNNIDGIELSNEFEINIYGHRVDPLKVDWHTDYTSGYRYPLNRFDNIMLSKTFNTGVEVKFPWELSRFQYAINLAILYRQSNDPKKFAIFKHMVTDWIVKNPFMNGINWYCTMEVAIRAANWIVASNIFGEILWQDPEFSSVLAKSLVRHAYFIENFPEKRINKQNSNHLISNYSGLFLISIALSEHHRSSRWREIAVTGLEECMQRQVTSDGFNDEASIPYHRLVVELFAIPCLFADNSTKQTFSDKYYMKLFRMFEFVSSCIDSKGNAPQIGDNDSGIFVRMSSAANDNYSYLIELAHQIFNYNFYSPVYNESHKYYLDIMPRMARKIDCFSYMNTLDCSKSTAYIESGFYFIKNSNFSVSVACITKTSGGHRHFDTGSITISYKGIPIVVDSGTGCYTSDMNMRNTFRDYVSHNLIYKKNEINIGSGIDYFHIIVDYKAYIIEFADNKIIFEIYSKSEALYRRKIEVFDNYVSIEDSLLTKSKDMCLLFHFNTATLQRVDEDRIGNDNLIIECLNAESIDVEDYLYSREYRLFEKCKKIVITPKNELTLITKILCN